MPYKFTGNEIKITGVIAADEDVAGFERRLNGIRNNVTVLIDSPGGNGNRGFGLANAIGKWQRQNRAAGYEATAVVTRGGSVASVIASVCNVVEMASPSATMFFHEAQGDEANPYRERFNNTLAQVYARKTGASVETWRNRLTTPRELTAAECVRYNLATRVRGAAGETTGSPIPGVSTAEFVNAVNSEWDHIVSAVFGRPVVSSESPVPGVSRTEFNNFVTSETERLLTGAGAR